MIHGYFRRVFALKTMSFFCASPPKKALKTKELEVFVTHSTGNLVGTMYNLRYQLTSNN